MKPWCFGIAVGLSAGVLVSAQQSASVADEVLRLERAQTEANVKKDRAAYDRLLADDYTYVHSNGTLNNKTEDIGSTMSSDMKWTSDVLTETKVRVYGDAAIVNAIETMQGAAKEYQPGPRRLTDVWVKRTGGWQLVAGITTLISKDTRPNSSLSAVKTLNKKTIPGKTADERAALQADQAFAQSDLDKDESRSKAMQTRDYTFVSRAGALVSPNDPPTPRHTSNIVAYDSVRAYGTVAVVQGSLLWSDVNRFSPGVLRFVRVWVKEGTDWKLAAEQRTPIAAPVRARS